MSAYHNPTCATIADFEEDLQLPSKIKRLLGRWKKDPDDLNVRLVINHITTYYTVFRPDFATRTLYERVGAGNRTALNTFLVILKYSWDFVDVNRDLAKLINAELAR